MRKKYPKRPFVAPNDLKRAKKGPKMTQNGQKMAQKKSPGAKSRKNLAPTLGLDPAMMTPASSAKREAKALVADQDALMPSNASLAEMLDPRQCQGLKKQTEKDLGKVWSASQQSPSTMVSLATPAGPEAMTIKPTCRGRKGLMPSGDTVNSTMVGKLLTSPCRWSPPPPSPTSGRSERAWRSWQATKTSS